LETKRLEGRDENIIDPDLPIIDAQHHLFDLPGNRYMTDDYLEDVSAGHRIVASVYCEARSFARLDGPEWMRPLGEVEFANGVGAMTATGVYGDHKLCAGIVGHADLTLGSIIGELLDRCIESAPKRFRGVRQVTVDYPDERPFRHIMTFRPRSGLLDTEGFPVGLAEIEKRGLVFDAAIFDPSLPKLTALVDHFPNLTFVLGHAGTAIGIDMSPEEKVAVFRRWSTDLRAIAKRPNVYCKVGGFGMPSWGFGFEQRTDTIGYLELAEAWRPYAETAIEAFGPSRCMMESNFPPDSRSCGYVPLWNALKHITRNATANEKAALFHDTAKAVYRLDLD
jgi:L-fuconolactonase